VIFVHGQEQLLTKKSLLQMYSKFIGFLLNVCLVTNTSLQHNTRFEATFQKLGSGLIKQEGRNLLTLVTRNFAILSAARQGKNVYEVMVKFSDEKGSSSMVSATPKSGVRVPGNTYW